MFRLVDYIIGWVLCTYHDIHEYQGRALDHHWDNGKFGITMKCRQCGHKGIAKLD